MTRRHVALGVLVALVAVAGVTAATIRFESAEQATADADAPDGRPLTAPVERRELLEVVVTRGTVSSPGAVGVFAPAVGDSLSVVTRDVPAVGTTLASGQVALEVAGRPVFVLLGSLPSYRDLSVGASGPDVLQLQEALQALGHAVRPSGEFTRATANAVRDLYRNAGYTAPTTSVIVDQDGDSTTDPVSPVTEELAMLPRSEALYLPQLPAYVASTSVRRGAITTDQPALTLATGIPALVMIVSQAQAALIEPGARALVALDAGDVEASIVSVAESPRDPESPTSEFEVLATFETPVDVLLVGRNYPVTVTIASSNEPVLAVPVSAVYSHPDGSVFVQRLRSGEDGGELEEIGIDAGPVIGGFVEIRRPTAALEEGDEVMIGDRTPR